MIKSFRIEDKDYKSNGDVVIMATKARVKNSDNGDFTLELSCSEEYADYVKAPNIIVCNTPQGEQPFRIWEVTQTGKKIEAKCKHIFYDTENFLITDFAVVERDCNFALNYFNSKLDTESPFSVYSDVATVNSLRSVRDSFEECISSILERWGGHLKRDGWNISILQNIGKDNGITIEYGKNLQEVAALYDWSEVVTKLLPVGKDGQLLDNLYVYSSTTYPIPFTKCVSFEQDIEEEDYPTEEAYIAALKADLLAQATKYINEHCIPSVNYTIKGKPEIVSDIGDIIQVKDYRIGIDITTFVMSYEWDAIAEKYTSLEFGNTKPTIKSSIENLIKKTP